MEINRNDIVASAVVYRRITGVYFLLNNDDIVYVGKSTDVMGRIAVHASGPKVFNRYHYIECEKDCLDELEADYIVHFTPKYNGGISPNGKWYTMSMLKRKLNTSAREIKSFALRRRIETVGGYYNIADFSGF